MRSEWVLALLVGLLVLGGLTLAHPAHAGFEFSISASSTDPFVNTSSPTGSIRNLYFWLTCTDEGLSAFEGDVTGSLTVLGFNPLNGVLNAGSPTALLLAVPGCPTGSEVNFLLGYWMVNDTGGTLCLEPSAANAIFGAVNCTPALVEDPELIGFASDGSSPCSIGEEGCEMGQMPLGARYEELASFDGRFPYRVPWSPIGQKLAFNGPGGVFVFDAGTPGSRPVKILEEHARYIEWAPDATWLLCKTQTAEENRRGVWSLCAVPVDGRPPVQILNSHGFDQFTWGDDGYIYYWTYGPSREWVRVEPPSEWRHGFRGASLSRRSKLIWTTAGSGGARDHHVFRATTQGVSQVHLARFPTRIGFAVLFSDGFPDGEHLLVRVHGGHESPYDLVIDTAGRTIVDFRDEDPLGTYLMRTSVSSDGKYLAAFHTIEDSHDIISSELYLVDPDARWRIPLAGAPMGFFPHLSRDGHLIAFQSFPGGTVHVGQVHISYH